MRLLLPVEPDEAIAQKLHANECLEPDAHQLGAWCVDPGVSPGGMGEVYRARDTTLGREVAVKILPEQFATDRERVARFEREARTLASLNHPHIAQIYGLEHSPAEAGRSMVALVMELVDGDDLSQRIARGAIPLEEAVTIARQIADALDAAHGQGIVHRDLKPANVKLRDDGTVKVLDFGLAKPVEGPAASSGATITSPAMSMPGVILGTAAYMAPEQAKGRPVDKRADIWAFGCVLYEMVTGRRAFGGDDVSETIASILKNDPDWTGVPASIMPLLVNCLRKDPKQRLRDIGDARLALDGAFDTPASGGSGGTRFWQQPLFLLAAGISLIAASGLITWSLARGDSAERPPVRRLAITFTDSAPDAGFALSPDGTRLVYAAMVNGRSQLYVRSLDQFDAEPLAGTEDGRSPFFSPDGEWVAFFSPIAGGPGRNRLQKLSMKGGRPQPICDTSSPRGGTWSADGKIVFASGLGESAKLFRVPVQGGSPEALEGDALNPAWPEMLPGGAVLFTSGPGNDPHLTIVTPENGQTRSIGRGYYGRYLPTGHVVYMLDDVMVAQPFEASTLNVTGPPVTLLEGVQTAGPPPPVPSFAVSVEGTLVYGTGPSSSIRGTRGGGAVLVSRDGRSVPLPGSLGQENTPRVSPDQRQVAFARGLPRTGADGDIWIHDLTRGTWQRLTPDPSEDNSFPVWTPDGTRVTFTSVAGGPEPDFYWQRLDKSRAELLYRSARRKIPGSWSPDGTVLSFYEVSPQNQRDIWMLTAGGEARPFLVTPFNELAPGFSRDGRCLAYVSDDSGEPEVYVQAYPGPGRRIAISTGGGEGPVWSHDGRELFYFRRLGPGSGQLMTVAVTTEPACTAGVSRVIFDGPYLAGANPYANYDVFRDGKRFVMIQALPEDANKSLSVILNWSEELKQRVPTR